MEREFRMWIKWYGKKCSQFKIEMGDFLDEWMKEKINSASYVLPLLTGFVMRFVELFFSLHCFDAVLLVTNPAGLIQDTFPFEDTVQRFDPKSFSLPPSLCTAGRGCDMSVVGGDKSVGESKSMGEEGKCEQRSHQPWSAPILPCAFFKGWSKQVLFFVFSE